METKPQTERVGVVVFYEVTSYNNDMERAYNELLERLKQSPPLELLSSGREGGYSFKYMGSQGTLRVLPIGAKKKVYLGAKQ